MPSTHLWLLALLVICLLAKPSHAFGAGNIASVSALEGHNWRHGDIEDVLKTVACLRGHKWTSMMIKRVYFGNWLRDYSQAVDVGTLKGTNKEVIRILVWILGFMSFGYATEEFEVTEERLGTYRPEEHIDNPKDYADNQDARKFDPRLRGPVQQEELDIDPETGMKNYIANERGGWATSLGYVKHSFTRSIHYGRVYTSGARGSRGNEADLCEALRCLGQGLHCLEDFGAHSNYTELSLRELGLHDVFPHVGTSTGINLRGKHVFPLVTGTFGGVDFLHSVLGEVTDHVSQSTVDEQQAAQVQSELDSLTNSLNKSQDTGSAQSLANFTSVLSKVPGTGDLCREAESLQAESSAQASRMRSDPYGSSRGDSYGVSRGDRYESSREDRYESSRGDPYGSSRGDTYSSARDPYGDSQSNRFSSTRAEEYGSAPPSYASESHTQGYGQEKPTSQPGGPAAVLQGIDLQATVKKIYPILAFRDRVMRSIDAIVSKIPGLESLLDKISETVTLFIMSLLAPFVTPIVEAASKQLKTGSTAVVDSSAKHQYEVWQDPRCSDPTHSLLSKDHFTNILNEPAGQVAAEILKYVAPRVVYAWDNPDVPVDEVLADVGHVFHHPAMRERRELHDRMFSVVERWMRNQPGGGQELNRTLGSESVRRGGNHRAPQSPQGQAQAGYGGGGRLGGGSAGMGNLGGFLGQSGGGGSSGGLGSVIGGIQNIIGSGGGSLGGGSGFPSFGRRELDEGDRDLAYGETTSRYEEHSSSQYSSERVQYVEERREETLGTEGYGGPQSGNYGNHQHNQFGQDYRGGEVGYDAYAPAEQQYGQSGYGQRREYDRQEESGGYEQQDESYARRGDDDERYGGREYRGEEEGSGRNWGEAWGSGRGY